MSEHKDRIRIGSVLMIISMSLLAVWGAGLASQTRRREGSFPVLTYAHLTNIAAGTAMIIMSCIFWMIAAFRPGDIPATTTQTLVDAAYLTFLCTWIPFTLWSWSCGAAILLDRSARPVWPRWVGYLSFWAGLAYAPGFGLAFFKDGAFSWNGVLGLWCPCVSFFIWLVVITWYAVKNVNEGYVYEEPEIDGAGSNGNGVVRDPGLRAPAAGQGPCRARAGGDRDLGLHRRRPLDVRCSSSCSSTSDRRAPRSSRPAARRCT